MSTDIQYKKERCSNPNCKKIADICNENCWIEVSDDFKYFCSEKCKLYYLKHKDEYEEIKKLYDRIYKSKSRNVNKITDAIYLLLNKRIPKNEIRNVVVILCLYSYAL